MPKSIPTTTLRDNLADTLNALGDKDKFFLITKKGEPVSALVELDFFEDLLALSSPSYLESIKKARSQAEHGELFSHDDVFGIL